MAGTCVRVLPARADAARGHGDSRAAPGPGDDVVYAYGKDTVLIDCGAGNDTVQLGNNRAIQTRRCEKKTRL